LIKFTIYCAHRSGSNFLQQLIVDNFEDCDYIENDHNKTGWKHQSYHPAFMDGKDFCLIIARHPVKWVNSCMRFNADMWKWWNVNGEEPGDLSFLYKKRYVSIVKMMTKWNAFYNGWLRNTDCKFIWFPDLLVEKSRNKILKEIGLQHNLTKKDDNITVPKKVQHSEKFTEEKRLIELNMSNNDMLNDKPYIIDYINHNIDNELLQMMMEYSINEFEI